MIPRFATTPQVYSRHSHTRAYKRSNMAYMPRVSSWLSASEDHSCNHDYAPMFFNLVKSTEALTCAPCLVRICITDIKAVQAGLQDRGGIFLSKRYGRNDHTDGRPTQHRGWTNKWQSNKIRCYNVVRRLEQVRADIPSEARECGVHEALRAWEEAKQECCQVPGYRYIDGDPEISAAQGRGEIHASGEKIQLERFGPPKLKARPNRPDLDAVITGPMRLTSAPPLSHEDRRLSGLNDVVICENKSVYSPQSARLKGPLVGSSNEGTERVETIVPQTLVVQDALKKPRKDSEGSSTITAAASCTPEAGDARGATKPPILRSVWKPAAPRSAAIKRQVTFDPLVTILPHYNDPSPTIVKKHHNAHTTVYECHNRLLFNRKCNALQRGTWASPCGYTKVDTSHIGTSWLGYERLQRNLDEEEAEEKIKTSDDDDRVTVAEASAEVGRRQWKLTEFQPRVVLPYGLNNVNMRRGSRAKTLPAPCKKVALKKEESER